MMGNRGGLTPLCKNDVVENDTGSVILCVNGIIIMKITLGMLLK